MTYHVETMKQVTDLVMRLRSEEGDITFEDLDVEPGDLESLADLWLLASEWKTAANLVEKVIGAELISRGLPNHSVEVAGLLVFAALGTTRENCTDVEAFFDWLDDNPSQTRRIFNPNAVKKGSLPPAVRDTFFLKEKVVKPDSEPVPVAVPVQVLEDNKIKKGLADG